MLNTKADIFASIQILFLSYTFKNWDVKLTCWVIRAYLFQLKYNLDWIVNSKSDRFYKVRDLLNSAGDKYPSVPCKRMLLNQWT